MIITVLLTTAIALALIAAHRSRGERGDRALSERLRREAQYDRTGWEGPTVKGRFWQ